MSSDVFRMDCSFAWECSSIFRQLPGLLMVMAPDLSVSAATERYIQTIHMSDAAAMGRNVFDVLPANPDAALEDQAVPFVASFDRVRQSLARDDLRLQRYDLRKSDGEYETRYWNIIHSPVLDLDGKLRWIVQHAEDATELVRLKGAAASHEAAEERLWHDLERLRGDMATMEAEARDARQELRCQLTAAEAASQEKSQVLSMASHDLRQPVQAALLFAHSLEHMQLPTGAGERLKSIESVLGSLDRMLGDLLELSRLDAGKMAVSARAFPAEELLGALADEFRPLAESAGLTFRFDGCPFTLFTDPILLERILRNLLANAIKYTPRGGAALHCRRRGAYIRIFVSDSGIGIPRHEQGRIFDEYYRVAQSTDQREGLGVGLATVARAAKLLGHRLTLCSRVGRGSTFSVLVPLALV